MAIAVHVGVFSGSTGEGTHRLEDILEGPPLAEYHVAAVGVQDIAVGGGRVIELRSQPDSDPVLVRFQLDAVSTQASAGDAGTIRLEPGQIVRMGVDEGADSDDMELDFRAATSLSQKPVEYETVAASQTAQALGATGAAGDLLEKIIITPTTTSPGAVTVLDNATTFLTFAGGATSVVDLRPFEIVIGARSVSGAWKITTGANVSVQAVGDFT